MRKVNEPMPQIKSYVNKLKEKFPRQLAHIMPDRILYTSFSRKSSKVLAKIGPIPSSLARFLQGVEYNLQVHLESWNDRNEGRRMYVVLHELTHIPEEGFTNSSRFYKRTIQHDLIDFKHLRATFGLNLQNVTQLRGEQKKQKGWEV